MGTIRDFLRVRKRKIKDNSKQEMKEKFKGLIVNEYYKILDKCLKNEELRKYPEKLWKDVNLQWNMWLTGYIKGLKTKSEVHIFRSVLDASIILINKEFQERKQILIQENRRKYGIDYENTQNCENTKKGSKKIT